MSGRRELRRRFSLGGMVAISLLSAGNVQARPYSLVCFERQAIEASLARVRDPQQFLRNDSILRDGSCDFVQIPKGSTARFERFFRSGAGYVFPVFSIRYATTGQRMFAVDGIFDERHWAVTLRCGRGRRGQPCLVPKSCSALDGFVAGSGDWVADYIAVPDMCREYVIQ